MWALLFEFDGEQGKPAERDNWSFDLMKIESGCKAMHEEKTKEEVLPVKEGEREICRSLFWSPVNRNSCVSLV